MKKDIEIEIVNKNDERIQELMSKAIFDIIKKRIEDLPEQIRVEAYDILIEQVNELK